jgi:hypothetical protein
MAAWRCCDWHMQCMLVGQIAWLHGGAAIRAWNSMCVLTIGSWAMLLAIRLFMFLRQITTAQCTWLCVDFVLD